jgi:hypothetical protein
VRRFTAGANCGGGGTMSAQTVVSHASGAAPGQNIVPQPNDTTHALDSLGDRIMQRVRYRRIGAAESLWVVHTVRPAGAATAPQWAQINVSGGTIATAPVQQGIHAPDSLYRWMGSIAVDGAGNMAMGYSTSGDTAPNFPSIAYVGRLATDPAGQLAQTETQLVAGGGSQVNTCGGACHRWGDYSALSVDPVDDCTFWYTNQYYDTQANGDSGNWHTRIGSFRFPSCGAASCASRPQAIAPLLGIRILPAARFSWPQEPNSAAGYRLYAVTDKTQIPRADASLGLTPQCSTGTLTSTICDDPDAFAALQPSLLHYQLVGVCTGGGEGAH